MSKMYLSTIASVYIVLCSLTVIIISLNICCVNAIFLYFFMFYDINILYIVYFISLSSRFAFSLTSSILQVV